MPDIPDLSKLRAVQNGQPEQLDYDSLTDEERAQIDAQAEETPEHDTPEGLAVRTAFTVFVQNDGTVQVTPDLGVQYVRENIPSADEVYGALAVLLRDFQAQATAQENINAQMAIASQIRQQQQYAQDMASLGDLRGPQR